MKKNVEFELTEKSTGIECNGRKLLMVFIFVFLKQTYFCC